MPLLASLKAFAFSIRGISAAVGLVTLLGGFFAFKANEQSKGAAKLATKIEANNAAVTSKAATAARKSTDDAAPGVRNPRYRAD